MVQLRPIERPTSREVWNTNMAILASPFSHRYLASEPAPIVGTAMSARGERCPEGGARVLCGPFALHDGDHRQFIGKPVDAAPVPTPALADALSSQSGGPSQARQADRS